MKASLSAPSAASPVPPLPPTRPALATPFLFLPGAAPVGCRPISFALLPLFLCLSRRDSPLHRLWHLATIVRCCCCYSRMRSEQAEIIELTPLSLSLSLFPSHSIRPTGSATGKQDRLEKGQLLIDDESRKLGFTHKSCNGSGVFTVFTDGAFRCSRLWGF